MHRVVLAAASGLLMMSCVAHGTGGLLKHENYTPYSVDFYTRLLSGRVWIYENRVRPETAHVPHAVIFSTDGADPRRRLAGTVYRCSPHRRDGVVEWVTDDRRQWGLVWGNHGSTVQFRGNLREPRYTRFFYDPITGAADVEIFKENVSRERSWVRPNIGWIQDSWPRSLADACPDLPLPAGMQINEKQTSLALDDLREQDPDAPIRHFAGSGMTAPGRTGLAASNAAPTTTKEEVWSFLRQQEGNILLNPMGVGRVFVSGGGRHHEIWRFGNDNEVLADFDTIMRETADGERLEWLHEGDVKATYTMGYPFPYLPTGHRHAAFQLTDALIESGEPVVLPWMPKEWKDFAFRANGTVLARRANGGLDRLAPWRWTKARLWVQIGGNREAPGWEEVAEHLGMEKPKLWTPADGQRIEVASAEPATSGTGKCVGDHEGVATWTLGADGKRVWDTSGCRRVK